MTRVALGLLALTACASLPTAPRVAQRVEPAPPPVAAEAPPRLVWTALATRSVPAPITAVAALSGQEAVFLAPGGVYRWNGADAPTRVCPITDLRAAAIQAHDDRFVALGGAEDAPVVWRSDDRGAHCDTLTLPSLSVQGHAVGALRLALDHATAFAWSTSGLALRSDDGGAHWRPLPRIDHAIEVARGPDGSTLAAVQSSALSARGAPRAVIYQLASAPDATWRMISAAGTRRAPLAFQTLRDDAVRVTDAIGALTLSPDGTVRDRVDFVEYSDDRAVPRIIAPASDGRFFAAAPGPLLMIDAQGPRAFAYPAGLRALAPGDPNPRARRPIDVSTDGTVWITDGVGVWRGALGGAVTELTDRPLDEVPRVMAARGDTLALASPSAQIAISHDGGVHWQRLIAPLGTASPRAMAIDARGTVLVLTANTLLVCEGASLTSVALPDRNARISQRPVIGMHGDRWVIVDGEVLTSDDQGAHWISRFRPESPPGATSVMSAAIDPRDRLLVLDQSQSLWQSTDAAQSFTRWSASPFAPDAAADAHGNRLNLPPVAIAWDGASEAWLMHLSHVAHTANAGASFDVDVSGLNPADFYLAPDGHRFVVASPTESFLGALCPGNSTAAYIKVSRGEGYAPIPELCAHRAAAWAFDGDRLYVVDPVGSLSRASLASLAALAEAGP